jgi:hypothetical protein
MGGYIYSPCDPRPVTRDLWPVTCDMWPVTCDPWPVTRELWSVTREIDTPYLWHKTNMWWPCKTKQMVTGLLIKCYCHFRYCTKRLQWDLKMTVLPNWKSYINLHKVVGNILQLYTSIWAIPFNIRTPLWTRISEGVWKGRFWGVVCIGILWSLRFFWGVRQKFLNFWGGNCVGTLIFFS